MNLKDKIKSVYTKIVETDYQECVCDTSLCGTPDYSNIDGYNKEADYGLGCGLPTTTENLIKQGYTVIDLGSGAGNDAFIVSKAVGEKGKVIGIDFTPEMNSKARDNAKKLGINNIEFIEGDIENIPLPESIADVVISNCVMNLVEDKRKAYNEVFRILKNDGKFGISDIVFEGNNIPVQVLDKLFEAYGGCLTNPPSLKNYLQIIEDAGFKNIEISTKKELKIDFNSLNIFNDNEKNELVKSDTKIFSITFIASK
jgi:ubiquinone/menaquinone biosynthesis C-methylase UbiE